ncbi:hypothetical protein Avbf_10669 [Armadillidium vulgare]|nr:hypothetical protein Avbf_10669 [Armadillidium vulgare]
MNYVASVRLAFLAHCFKGKGYEDDLKNKGLMTTVTIYSTKDVYETVTDEYYNTLPVVRTDFTKLTVTAPVTKVYNSCNLKIFMCNEVIKEKKYYLRNTLATSADDNVEVRTTTLTKPTTEIVTDIVSKYKCYTEVSTEFYPVTHLDQSIIRTTVTSMVVHTHTYPSTVIKTVLSTQKKLITKTEVISQRVWKYKPKTKYHKKIFDVAKSIFKKN